VGYASKDHYALKDVPKQSLNLLAAVKHYVLQCTASACWSL